MKLAKRDRRGELWCGDGGANTGEPDVCVGMSMDVDRFEVFVVALRNEDSDSLGDEGALDGAEEGCLSGARYCT